MRLSVNTQLTEVSPCCIVQFGRLQLFHAFACGSCTLGVLSRGDNFLVTTLKDVIVAVTDTVPLFFLFPPVEHLNHLLSSRPQRVYL